MQLDSDSYSVIENEGSVEVCVTRSGQTTEDIPVTIIAQELSPADAKGKRLLNHVVMFTQSPHCFILWYFCFQTVQISLLQVLM